MRRRHEGPEASRKPERKVEELMRIERSRRKNQGRRILVGAGMLALGFAGLVTVQRRWMDSARLVSVEDYGDSCYLPTSGATTPTASPEESLFPSFEATAVHALDSG